MELVHLLEGFIWSSWQDLTQGYFDVCVCVGGGGHTYVKTHVWLSQNMFGFLYISILGYFGHQVITLAQPNRYCLKKRAHWELAINLISPTQQECQLSLLKSG